SVNLKSDPEEAVALRERYADVRPGYHMNKTHWNTVGLQGDVPAAEIRAMADASYALVRASLPRSVRDALSAG
ncbi:MAG TPA: MmcQ/YjbR family DNA-binding protein, partial [Rubricoccaceae bacterium]